MPDQNDQSQSSPQSLVDAALGATTETKTVDTSAPVVTPISPMTPPPLSPLAPLAPSTSTTTTVTQTGATPTVAMGDDTPLAFASMPGSTTTTTTSQTTPAAPAGSMESSYIPPVPGVAQAPTGITPAPEKKKSKMGKILAVFFGLLMLGGAAFGGYTYYINNFGETTTVAEITERKDCVGCSPDGFEWRWHSATSKCSKSAIKCGSQDKPGDDINTNLNTQAKCHANGEGNPGFWCGKTPDGKCGGFCNTSGTKTCNELLQTECGFTQTYGSSCSLTKDSKYFYECDCSAAGGNAKTYFDRSGLCSHVTNNTGAGAVVNDGLCYQKAACDNNKGGTQYDCNNAGCTSLTNNCVIKKYTCKEMVDGTSCVPSTPGFISQTETISSGTNVKFDSVCGTVEQIDVACGKPLTYAASRTKVNPPCVKASSEPSAPPSTPPAAPTMSCTGLTSVPALTPTAPVIGTKLTFTCAGIVTPSTAGTLSYKFRYSIDTGAYKTLANKTPTTAELSVDACGTYSVECQACATLAGVLTCNPIWTGATQ